jgi:signal transduction histidine kinase
MNYALAAKQLAQETKNVHRAAEALFYESYALTNKGLIDSSLRLADECLLILSSQLKDPVLEAKVLNQKGRCFMRKNQYKEAIEMGYNVITKAEQGKDTLVQMMGKTLIGWAYLEMGQSHEALTWHLNALRTTNNIRLHEKYSILFANLAINYRGLDKVDSAFYYIEKAIQYARKHQNLFALSNSLAIRAQLYVRSGQPQKAEASLEETVAIRKLIGDPFYIVSDMAQLGLYYANNGQAEKGVAICKEGIEIANRYKIETKLFFLYGTLADNYRVIGDDAMYAGTLEKIISLKDSVYQKNSAEAIADLQAKYELQRKEKDNIQLQLENTRLELINTKKDYLIYGSILLSALALFSAYLVFRNYRRKQQMKMSLVLAEEKRLAEQAVSEAEEKERKRIAADLHDNLGAYAASIASNLDNITVPKNDQDSLSALHELRTNSQSIVAQLNDTIWALKKETLTLTNISDRIKVFVQRIQPSYPDILIDIKENIINDHRLQPTQAFHLFRIIQEAINNAIRHSRCTQVEIGITSGNSWKIVVQDNGTGFVKKAKLNTTSHGLSNMEARAAEAGWHILWKSNTPPEKGTQVVIESTTN